MRKRKPPEFRRLSNEDFTWQCSQANRNVIEKDAACNEGAPHGPDGQCNCPMDSCGWRPSFKAYVKWDEPR